MHPSPPQTLKPHIYCGCYDGAGAYQLHSLVLKCNVRNSTATGDAAEAARTCQEVLKIWHGADPELPALKEVRHEGNKKPEK